MAHYFDTSALIKLVIREPESAALQSWLAETAGLRATSDLSRVELVRAARRAGPEYPPLAAEVLADLVKIEIGEEVLRLAGVLGPQHLRSLDAVHLATALQLQSALEGVVTYDRRMADAAAALGIPVVAPS